MRGIRKINFVEIFRGVLFGAILFIPSLVHAQGQQSHKSSIEISATWEYLLYLPSDYQNDTTTQFPLMLYLHGGGESGGNIEELKRHGLPGLIEEGKEFPFIILSPQNPHKKKFWDDTAVIALLDEVQKNYRVDPKRIYLLGVSRGAYGAWHLMVQYPDRFAAVVAISGEAPATYAQWVTNMPVWVFHGMEDESIPISESDSMVAALRKNGNQVRYTRYEDTGHDAWTATFKNQEVYEWLLRQRTK